MTDGEPQSARYEDLTGLLAANVPELREEIEAVCEWWAPETPGQHIIYEDILVQYLIKLIEAGTADGRLQELFVFVEELAKNPDVHVQEVVAYTVLEGLLGEDLLDYVRPFMGPATLVMSDEVEQFWAEVRAARREERAKSKPPPDDGQEPILPAGSLFKSGQARPGADARFEGLNDLLAGEIPELRDAIEALCLKWAPKNPGPYNLYGDVVGPYLVKLMTEADERRLQELFAFLEELSRNPDARVKAVVRGCVFQCLNDDKALRARARQFMGPATLALSYESEKFWNEFNASPKEHLKEFWRRVREVTRERLPKN
jgi:hypothetical protein